VSRVWVNPVLRDAGHQTSLFSIRPPEVLRRASLEDSSPKPGSISSRAGGSAPSVHLQDRSRGSVRSASAIATRESRARPIEIHVFDPVRLSMIR